MDWKEEFKSHGLHSGRKLCTQYEFSIDKANSPIIKIYVWEQFNGYFFATTDHSIQNADQGSPSRQENAHSTAEQALKSALSSLMMFVKEPYDKIKFIRENWV